MTPPKPTPPVRRPNAEVRGREHLTPAEVDRLAAAAAKSRAGRRDALMIRVAFRHGLRAAELVGLRRDQLDLDGALLHVRRVKKGVDSTHPLAGWEVRGLRRLVREGPQSAFVFLSNRGAPLTERAFHGIVARAGAAAGLPVAAHPHMLRHACGFKLANEGQDTRAIQLYLGHANIQHTVRYTTLAADRFRGFWKD